MEKTDIFEYWIANLSKTPLSTEIQTLFENSLKDRIDEILNSDPTIFGNRLKFEQIALKIFGLIISNLANIKSNHPSYNFFLDCYLKFDKYCKKYRIV